MSKLPVPRNAVVNDVMTLNAWANRIHAWGVEKGWSTEETPIEPQEVRAIIIEKLLMMHTEISEATEALRDVPFDRQADDETHFMNWISHSFFKDGSKPEGIASELADTIIRVLHLCAILGIDIEEEVKVKMVYNWSRTHRHGGKNL